MREALADRTIPLCNSGQATEVDAERRRGDQLGQANLVRIATRSHTAKGWAGTRHCDQTARIR
jgi:hypothetical protein